MVLELDAAGASPATGEGAGALKRRLEEAIDGAMARMSEPEWAPFRPDTSYFAPPWACSSSSPAAAGSGCSRPCSPTSRPASSPPPPAATSAPPTSSTVRRQEMPVVEVRNHGLWLLAKNVNQYIHRILVEADSSADSGDDLWSAVREDLWSDVGEAGANIYKRGDFKESEMADLDVYLLKKVGLFPDILERKASRHLEKGDHVSALITGEFYTRDQFPGLEDRLCSTQKFRKELDVHLRPKSQLEWL
ncbi:hypothetical protein ZWY2020_017972 [Hordeum vulgare]|nr:hypothetical protein ZWY2020_017972 [Hordeum vulgare]